MKANISLILLTVVLSSPALPQNPPQKAQEERPIRISTQLVQLDAVVTDKKGKVVPGLSKADFEVFEGGKKQQISFFEYVDASRADKSRSTQPDADAARKASSENSQPAAEDVHRTFAFVVDDLTIRYDDLVYLRDMLNNFVDTRMNAGDLVAIIRTVGGKGLLQQFTSDKTLLKRAIAALTPVSHALSQFNNQVPGRSSGRPAAAGDGGVQTTEAAAVDVSGDAMDPSSPQDDINKAMRAYMSLGTANFVVDSMKQLPGRKSLVLISGGLPLLTSAPSTEVGIIANFVNSLIENATRAGVAIHTMDLQGLGAYRAVATFEETPGKSGLASSLGDLTGNARTASNPTGSRGSFGRTADESMLGPDTMTAHQGLRVLASATGGMSVLTKNDFVEGLDQIVSANEGYYLLAYTPSDSNFDNKFRKVEIKVKGGYKLYSRRGYMAKEDTPAAAPATKQEELLAALRSPVARRDLDIDALLLYKPAQANQGAIDIFVTVDPRKIKFEDVGDKKQTDYDVAGFVFDQMGKLRGGFSNTITAGLTSAELEKASASGLSYSANTMLPPGAYQIRIAVRDNKSNNIGTLSRYLEVPDLTKGLLSASSILIGAVAPGDTKGENPTPITANRQISRKQDLRYAVMIYNAKLKDGKPQCKTQLTITAGDQILLKEPEQPVNGILSGGQLLKWGQFGLSGVKPGRYTMTITITDTLADKKSQTMTRRMDFVVVN